MAYQYYDAEVVKIIDETDKVKRFFLQIKNIEHFNFIPGQFVMLDLPIDTKIRTRSYSISSAPEANVIEMIIVEKEGGAASNYLFGEVQLGTIIKTSKALGRLILQYPITQELCFIATGTGVGPFRSMLLDMVNKQLSFSKVTLIFGTRYEKDILYYNEFTELKKQLLNFEYIPVLSREENWKGEKGYVHQVYENLFADKHSTLFYLCGWANMIKEARERLHSMGYDKSQVKFEVYD
jgi:CDP-4-dehydro-6-deoxyglucose reductase